MRSMPQDGTDVVNAQWEEITAQEWVCGLVIRGETVSEKDAEEQMIREKGQGVSGSRNGCSE